MLNEWYRFRQQLDTTNMSLPLSGRPKCLFRKKLYSRPQTCYYYGMKCNVKQGAKTHDIYLIYLVSKLPNQVFWTLSDPWEIWNCQPISYKNGIVNLGLLAAKFSSFTHRFINLRNNSIEHQKSSSSATLFCYLFLSHHWRFIQLHLMEKAKGSLNSCVPKY